MPAPYDSLSNPVWSALTTHHSHIALGDDLARRYPSDFAPFAAVASNTAPAFESLATLIDPGHSVTLLDSQPDNEAQWTVLRKIPLLRMVYNGPAIEVPQPPFAIQPLSASDLPAILQLVELTHPGPFRSRTLELGRYLGIWQAGQLAAMAGERMHPTGYREISAVCTLPNFQRRGYARQLVLQLIFAIQSLGEVPFLHVVAENKSAQSLYESMGFIIQTELFLFVVKRN